MSVAGGAGLILPTGNGATGWTGSQLGSLLTSASFASGSSLGLDTSNGNLTYGGSINSPLTLTKLGANSILTLTASNNYSGGTIVSGGAVTAANNAALGTGPLSLASGATANFPTANPAIVGLSGAGSVVLGSPPSTPAILTINSNANSTFSGVISEAQGPSNIVKSGPNSLTLSGNNTYTGYTTVAAGTLVAGVSSIGTGQLNLSGGTFAPPAPLGLTAASYYGPNLAIVASNPHFQDAQNSLNNFLTSYLPQTAPNFTNNVTANVAGGANGYLNFYNPNNANDLAGYASLFPAPWNSGDGGGYSNWASSYTGYFYAATTGTYTFGLNSDDNSRLWINGGQANPDTAVVQNGTNGQGWQGYGIVNQARQVGTVYLVRRPVVPDHHRLRGRHRRLRDPGLLHAAGRGDAQWRRQCGLPAHFVAHHGISAGELRQRPERDAEFGDQSPQRGPRGVPVPLAVDRREYPDR